MTDIQQSWSERIQAKLEEEGREAGRMRAAVACELLGTDPENYRAYIAERVLAEAQTYHDYRTEKDKDGALRNATRFIVNQQLRALDSIAMDRALESDPERRRVAYEAMRVWLDVGRAIQSELGR